METKDENTQDTANTEGTENTQSTDANAPETEAGEVVILWLKNNSSSALTCLSKYGEIHIPGRGEAGPFEVPAEEEATFRKAPFLATRPWISVVTDEERAAVLKEKAEAEAKAEAAAKKKAAAAKRTAAKK